MSIDTETGLVPEWDLADRMRKAMRAADVGVQEMADYLGVSRNAVGTWINGRIEPRTQTVRLWALRTGVPYTWLSTGAVGPEGDGGGAAGRPRQDSNLRPRDYKGAGDGQQSWSPATPLRERRANPLSRPAAAPAAWRRSA
jgi:transcriptional regulator with XRE-family HTH domain